MTGDIKDSLIERIKNPFWGYFLVVWLYINWNKVLILAFGYGTIENRIANIENLIKFRFLLIDAVIIPFVIALPLSWVMEFVFISSVWAQAKAAKKKAIHEDDISNSKMQAQRLRELRRTDEDLEESAKKLQIEKNNHDIDNMEVVAKNLRDEVSSLTNARIELLKLEEELNRRGSELSRRNDALNTQIKLHEEKINNKYNIIAGSNYGHVLLAIANLLVEGKLITPQTIKSTHYKINKEINLDNKDIITVLTYLQSIKLLTITEQDSYKDTNRKINGKTLKVKKKETVIHTDINKVIEAIIYYDIDALDKFLVNSFNLNRATL